MREEVLSVVWNRWLEWDMIRAIFTYVLTSLTLSYFSNSVLFCKVLLEPY